MKISTLTRLTGLLLVAGFFISCSSSKANLNELLDNEKYEQALKEIDSRLDKDPSQPDLYIQKAIINAKMAKREDPEIRADFYHNVAGNFVLAAEFGASQDQMETIDSLKQQYWKFEHNAGLRVSENTDKEARYQLAKIHFQNATIIRAEAISSYENLSVAQYQLGELDAAINSLKSALDEMDEPSAEIYENLGYLYLEKGVPDEAAKYYELANKNIDTNPNIAFGLINAYISNGNHNAAVERLELLVDENPQNANLRNVYGTQLYAITESIIDDLAKAYAENDTSLVNQIRFEAEGMGDEAETQLIEAFKRDTANTDYLESLAVFYNNLSAQYLSLSEDAFESHRTALLNKAYTLIEFAIDYYEKLVRINPDSEEYQQNLKVLRQLSENKPSSFE